MAIVTMIADPDLTARILPALVGIQNRRICSDCSLLNRAQPIAEPESRGTSPAPSKDWVIWLFRGLAMLFLFERHLQFCTWQQRRMVFKELPTQNLWRELDDAHTRARLIR
jgi:hypothetical protein